MSLNAESHSQVIEAVKRPFYLMATFDAARSAEEAIQAFYLAQIASWSGGKIKTEEFSCHGYQNFDQVFLSKACHSSEVIYKRRWCD